MKPEKLQESASKVEPTEKSHHLPQKSVFVGSKTTKLLGTREAISHKKDFMDKCMEGYELCASALKEKMPINNSALKLCSALDPEVHFRVFSISAFVHIIYEV